MQRRVETELLDVLPPADQGATGSRRDLNLLNFWLGHDAVLSRLLLGASRRSHRLVELGAGDGRFMLRLARRLSARWPGATVVLVDRKDSVEPQTLDGIAAFGWKVEVATADVFDWLQTPLTGDTDVILANLFLHHFSETRLGKLFNLAASRSACFVACEPRRSRPSLAASRMLGLIGCNSVTRHDAVISVRAGFTGRELSRLWPRRHAWNFLEQPVGWFTHAFAAERQLVA
jgi:hypothetical protein